jgi:hypothetical protein
VLEGMSPHVKQANRILVLDITALGDDGAGVLGILQVIQVIEYLGVQQLPK